MKKTYNINLSGVVFTMDEDAYDLLNDYLDTLEHALRREEDAREIVGDIESRAAELLLEKLGQTRNVVTLADVEDVIARIGRPEDMIEEVAVSSTDTDVRPGATARETVFAGETEIHVPPVPEQEEKPVKKLYRDPQNAMIGGVCAGLAAYLHVDVTWVRLFTVAISLLSVSTACIVYVILWIILPEARTPYQRMQMCGEAPTIANIGRNVTNNFKGEQGPGTPDNRTGFKKFLDNLVQILGVIAKIILVCVVIVAIPVVFALALALLGCLFAIIMLSTSWGTAMLGGYSTDILDFGSGVSPILGLGCGIAAILAIGIPLFALLRTVLWKRNPIGKGWKIALGTAWAISFVAMAVLIGIINVKTSAGNIRVFTETDTEKTLQTGPAMIISTDSAGENTTMIIRGNDTIIDVRATDKDNDLDGGSDRVTVKSRIKGR